MESIIFTAIGSSLLIYLLLALIVSAIIGSSISLYDSLKENERRTEFIVLSALGLGLSIIGLFNTIFAIAGLVCTIIAMALDEKVRRWYLYIAIPIVIALVPTFLTYRVADEVNNTHLQQIDINSIQGLDGVSNNGKMSNSSDKSSSNQTTETTTIVDTNNNGIPDSEEDLNNNGIPDIQESFEINVYQEGDDNHNGVPDIYEGNASPADSSSEALDEERDKNHNGVPDVYELSLWSTDGNSTSVSPTDVNE